jgi:hypothetical protein
MHYEKCMLRIRLIIQFILILNLPAIGQKWGFHTLVGNWRAANGAGLEVIDSNNIYVVYENEKKKVERAVVDFKSNPAFLDFEIKDSNSTYVLKTIFQFVTRDLIQWQVFEGERPANFSANNGELLYLRRKQ